MLAPEMCEEELGLDCMCVLCCTAGEYFKQYLVMYKYACRKSARFQGAAIAIWN